MAAPARSRTAPGDAANLTASVPESGHSAGACDGRLVRAFDLLGKRWNGLILGTLRDRRAGFAELRRAMAPITDSMLSERLAELVEAGLVDRTVTDTRPPGVIYALTDAGTAILPVLEQLACWAADNLG